jgi:iron complex outermembrane recepter protein
MTQLRHTLVGLWLSLVLCVATQAEPASTASLSFVIKRQSLQDALTEFGRQSGYQLLFLAEVTADVMAPEVIGTFTPQTALEKLLANSGLRYEFVNERTITIQSTPPSDKASRSTPTSRATDDNAALPISGQPEMLEEIIVTAQKRQERIQDVPFAITAVAQQEIRDRGSVDIKDLQYSVPGLNIQELQPGANRTTLRGITPGSGTGLPIVGIYVDDVGISEDQQQRDGAFPLVDIERIEVLRGPQGTLYGQGSIAGTIRYITRNPDLATADGFLETNVYQQQDGELGYRASGAVGVPLITDRVGLRVSAGYDRLAGWIDYPAAGVEDANGTKRVFIRPKLYARVTDQLTFSLLYQFLDQESDTDAISSVASPSVRPGRAALYPGNDEVHLANAIFSYDFGAATLLSSTGFQQRDLHFQVPFAPYVGDFPSRYEQVNQELRISSNGEGSFQYTAGVWYREFLSDINRIFFLNGAETALLRGLGDDPVDSESVAVFGDGTYSVSDRLDLSLGARYYVDERTSSSVVPPTPEREADFHSFSPRASMKYEWTRDVSSYVTVSKGFRSGGFNPSGTSFGPETLWNYEVGTKANLLGGAVFVDVAGYFLDYSDRQTQSLLPSTSSNVFLTETKSVGKASGFGVEGSISAQLGAGLRLDATAAYNDVRSDVSTVDVLKGERFGSVPDFTGSVSLSQRRALGAKLEGMWRIDYQHSDPFSYISRSATTGVVTTTQNFRTDPQDYLNVRLGVETQRLGVHLDAQNILNEDTVVFPFVPITTTGEGTRVRPRSYGVTLRWSFE